jgi:PAS domain S-box-containing protein
MIESPLDWNYVTQQPVDPRWLEALPFALVVVRQGQATYLNGLAAKTLAVGLEAFAQLRDREPGFFEFAMSQQTLEVRELYIAGERYYAKSIDVPEGARLILLLPFFLTDQDQLRQIQQRCDDFQEIFRHSFDGILVTDGAGTTLTVNEGCERVYDLKAEQMIGRNVLEFERQGLIRPVIARRVIAERKRISAIQQSYTGKTIMVTGIPLFDEAGVVRKVIINCRDTTELLKMQEELAQAQESLRRMESEVNELRQAQLRLDGVVLKSPSIQELARLALRVAKVDATVLITGESGAGKEVLARLIHKESARCAGPFIKVNCGAIPRELLESELFGYEGGAFTGANKHGKIGIVETASGGTLFLDEVGELPLDLQVKLLQVLQDRVLSRVGGTRSIPIDVRVLAATNRDLAAMVEQKLFRNDLYYRLNVIPIAVPPLRARREDVIPLMHHYLEEFNQRYALEKKFSEKALKVLLEYDWPGNVRELRNIVERLLVTTPADLIDVDDLPGYIRRPQEAPEGEGMDLKSRVAQFEAALVREAVERYGSTRAAAEQLKVSQSSVVRKLRSPGPAC